MADYSKRKTLVFDIEVAAYDFETHFDDEVKKYLVKYAKDEEDKLKIIESLVFSPFTSQTVAIGMIDYNDKKGCVLVNTQEKMEIESPHTNIKYICGDEKTVYELFWKIIRDKKYEVFVTFNGREFDCPYLMLRSFILGIKPSFNLMKGSDFTFKDYHVDLMKELTFNKHSPTGARRKFTLDFYCRMLGIKSPKSEGVTGDMVTGLYNEKQYKMIADYCIEDVFAEAELFRRWTEIF